MTEMIQYHKDEQAYGVICLNRPEKHNAINKKMVEQLQSVLQQAKQEELSFLVITGVGEKTFCSGGDLTTLHGELTPDEAFSYLYPMKEVLHEIISFPVPTICLLNGDALGGGCELATACDIRIAKAGAEFGFIQSRLGILPGWGGGALLYEKVHPSFAFQWLMEAETFEVEYLLRRGWLHHVIPTEEWGHRGSILEPYLSKSYQQMVLLKNQYKLKLSSLALSSLMNEEVRNCATLWDSLEHKEAAQRFLSN